MFTNDWAVYDTTTAAPTDMSRQKELETEGAFYSTKNSGLNFRNFRMSNGTVFSTRQDRSRSIPA